MSALLIGLLIISGGLLGAWLAERQNAREWKELFRESHGLVESSLEVAREWQRWAKEIATNEATVTQKGDYLVATNKAGEQVVIR